MPEIKTGATELSKNHLKELKKLQQKKFRNIEQKSLVEGLNLIEQLVNNRHKPVEIITSQSDKVVSIFKAITCPILIAKQHEILQLADTEAPQPIVAVFNTPEFEISTYRILLYLDGIQDPGNLGTIFRTAAAFNLDGIVLSPDCCEVFSPKVIRSSLGSVFWVASITADSEWMSMQQAEKIGLTASGTTTLKTVDIKSGNSVIIVIGSEGNGISKAIQSLLSQTVSIRISSQMESLNAAVAAGIALYEITGRFSY